MKKAALILGSVVLLTTVAFGQTARRGRTVDNLTLEKYKQQRLAAERDYRENYERMGFPSPEELDRQRENDMAARIELARQLRDARLEKERLELEQRSLNLEAARLDAEIEASRTNGYYDDGFFGGYSYGGFGFGGFGRGRHGAFNNRNRFFANGYRVTPFGVIQTTTPRPAPLLRTRGRHR